MAIKSSTLSISQRALSAERPVTALQERAQTLSFQLIQSRNARHIEKEALSFIHAHIPTLAFKDGILTAPLHSQSLASLGVHSPYGVKGGAAREILLAMISRRERRDPRDIDLVRRGPHALRQDDDVARRIMGRDFELGARVELIRDLSGYLSSRDLTINEVVAIDGTLHASMVCVLDSLGQILRPSKYRGGSLHRKPTLYGQSLLKMARLYAEGVTLGENWSITGIPDEVSFSEFELAVHLNKAFQRGREVAERFLHTLEILSLIGASHDRVAHALEELEHLRHGERGLFPDVPTSEWDALQSTLADD